MISRAACTSRLRMRYSGVFKAKEAMRATTELAGVLEGNGDAVKTIGG